MRRAFGLAFIISIVTVSAAACGGSSNGNVDGSPGVTPDGGRSGDAQVTTDGSAPDGASAVTAADVCGTNGALAKLLTTFRDCNPAVDEILFQGQLTAQSVSDFCNGSFDSHLTDGSIALPTRAELQACLDYIANTSCTDLDPKNTACDLAYGQVADGHACDSTQQCGDSSYCQGATGTTCGTCQPRAQDGASCTVDDECLNRNCIGTQCGSPSDVGDPCLANADCIGQRTCNTTTHKCELVTWKLNDACSGPKDCGVLDTGLYCKATAPTSPAGQCANYLALGAACTPPTQTNPLSGCDLRAYDWCNPNTAGGATCSAPNIVQVGHNCSAVSGNKCAAGLVCSNPITGGKCYAPGKEGDACGTAADPPCGLFLSCINNKCAYGNQGVCP